MSLKGSNAGPTPVPVVAVSATEIPGGASAATATYVGVAAGGGGGGGGGGHGGGLRKKARRELKDGPLKGKKRRASVNDDRIIREALIVSSTHC